MASDLNMDGLNVEAYSELDYYKRNDTNSQLLIRVTRDISDQMKPRYLEQLTIINAEGWYIKY